MAKKKLITKGWLGVKYNATPKVDEFYINDKGFVQQCTVAGEAINKTIVVNMSTQMTFLNL